MNKELHIAILGRMRDFTDDGSEIAAIDEAIAALARQEEGREAVAGDDPRVDGTDWAHNNAVASEILKLGNWPDKPTSHQFYGAVIRAHHRLLAALSTPTPPIAGEVSAATAGGEAANQRHREAVCDMILRDPESGDDCFIVSDLRTTPGGFNAFEVQSAPDSPKWRVELRITESASERPDESAFHLQGSAFEGRSDATPSSPVVTHPDALPDGTLSKSTVKRHASLSTAPQAGEAARVSKVLDAAMREAMQDGTSFVRIDPAAVYAPATPQAAGVSLTSAQIEAGWRETFSTENPFCPCDLKTFTKAVRWALRNGTAAGAAPEGWVLVPREPTEAMVAAYWDAGEVIAPATTAHMAWTAMLAAAQQPGAQPVQEGR